MSRHDYGSLAALAGLLVVLIGIAAVMYGKRTVISRPVESGDTQHARRIQQEAHAIRNGAHSK